MNNCNTSTTNIIAFTLAGLVIGASIRLTLAANGYASEGSKNDKTLEEISTGLTELATVRKVYDGDTIVVTVTKEYRIRMLDCWAPEVTGAEKEEGLKSKEFLESILVAGDEVLIRIPTTNRIQDSISFGRVLGYVYKDVDGDGRVDNISQRMVASGFATKEKMKK